MNNDKHEEMVKLKEEEKKLTQQINEESFGLEHIFRELSLIWTFADEEKRKQNFDHYPRLCAEQLMNGSSIELMDGDTSYIFCEWIEKLLIEVGIILKDSYNAKKGFVTSIMGL